MKKLVLLFTCLSLISCSTAIAKDWGSVMKGIKNTAGTIYETSGLKDSVNEVKNEVSIQNITNIASAPTQVEVSFFGGLKPDSSLVDILNTFKKYESVTDIQVAYSGTPIKENGNNINFKTKNSDKATISKYLEKTIPDGFYDKRSGYKIEDYTKIVNLANGKKGKTTKKIGDYIYLRINKIYINSVPCEVRIELIPSIGFYVFNPEKVIVGPTKQIAYPYIIKRITLDSGMYDDSAQTIAQNNKNKIISNFVSKYNLVNDGTDSYTNDFIRLDFYPELTIDYTNFLYINELESKYNDFKANLTIRESQHLDSGNDI